MKNGVDCNANRSRLVLDILPPQVELRIAQHTRQGKPDSTTRTVLKNSSYRTKPWFPLHGHGPHF